MTVTIDGFVFGPSNVSRSPRASSTGAGIEITPAS
jgi:hypothetical protein